MAKFERHNPKNKKQDRNKKKTLESGLPQLFIRQAHLLQNSGKAKAMDQAKGQTEYRPYLKGADVAVGWQVAEGKQYQAEKAKNRQCRGHQLTY